MNREEPKKQSPIFLKIRLAALEKAFDQIRTNRMEIEAEMNRGKLSEDDYSKSVSKLIVQGTQLKAEQRQIESTLGIQ
ncbi:MAG: hypothetical protein ACW99U_19130 [Candidatus Thorarchaeota archaeon]|jgi:hypothetical protein